MASARSRGDPGLAQAGEAAEAADAGLLHVSDSQPGIRRLRCGRGFRYRDGEPPEPATPRSAELDERVDALRESTRVEGKQPWDACVIRIVSATGRITADFAYEAADQWDITPDTLAEVAERARPG